MKKNEIREYLNDHAWLNNNNYGTHTLHLFYKNYCIVINGYWEYYNKLEIIIYKFNEKFTNITIAYHNDNIEEIEKILGKKFRNNTYETLQKKIVKIIKSNIENN